MNPQAVAEEVVGRVEWETAWGGYCQCPGRGEHTHPSRRRDCLVRIDGAPTVYCFHASCAGTVADANRRLRAALRSEAWELKLPGGRVLRAGEAVAVPAAGGELRRLVARADRALEIEERARQKLPEVLEEYCWPLEKIVAESPVPCGWDSGGEHFMAWLRLWPADAVIWTGDVRDSGGKRHAGRFRSVPEWATVGSPLGCFSCAASFRVGSSSRCAANVERRCFLVVESDVLSKDEVGAVFRYLHRRLRYRLHCIVDTGGKSLHAWFDVPRDEVVMAHLKAGLTGMGCDPRMFGAAQPVRVPGGVRDGKLQRAVWMSTRPGR